MSLFCLTLFLRLLPLPNESPQEVIDIFEGVQDDQALRMAANLGFKGALQKQVFTAHYIRSVIKKNVIMSC